MKTHIAVLLIASTSVFGQTRELGTFTLGAQTTGPAGFTCNKFAVTIPGQPIILNQNPLSGEIAYQKPTIPITAVAVFFSCGGGDRKWDASSICVPVFFPSLLNRGINPVEVK